MRYLPLTQADRAAMLSRIGATHIDELFRDVPASARMEGPIAGLPLHAGEQSVERHMRRLAGRNLAAGDAPSFVGAGAYRHHIPASVDHLIQRGEFLTAYTPYQPEIAQGTLTMLFEFQTQVARLFGCEVANASMYDGSTACWEAVAMARRITKRPGVLLSGGLHPHYVETVQAMAEVSGDDLHYAPPHLIPEPDVTSIAERIGADTSCVIVQYPDILGRIPDLSAIAKVTHATGALLIAVVTEPLALGALASPGELGADIVVGEGQSLSVGLQFGGPYLGLFATRQKFVRQMPGRLCGMTTDANGKRGFVLTLSTREQHIRREKATSNICTNSGLCALAFSIHMSLLGGRGLEELAQANHAHAATLADDLADIAGVRVLNDHFFNEFTLLLDRPAGPVVDALADRGILAGVPLSRLYPGRVDLSHALLVAVTETASAEDKAAFVAALREELA